MLSRKMFIVQKVKKTVFYAIGITDIITLKLFRVA